MWCRTSESMLRQGFGTLQGSGTAGVGAAAPAHPALTRQERGAAAPEARAAHAGIPLPRNAPASRVLPDCRKTSGRCG